MNIKNPRDFISVVVSSFNSEVLGGFYKFVQFGRGIKSFELQINKIGIEISE